MVLASPDLTRAVTLDTTGIQVWAIEGPDRLRELGPPIADFSLLDCAAVEFHPDGRLALARDRSGQVELWNIAGETARRTHHCDVGAGRSTHAGGERARPARDGPHRHTTGDFR
ncbi:hypothetical protein ACTD5D_27475 [Nocardia takedensis]|uniref:hypothetical protein n=1 Tax=Nocardia takedensis TaxID=259390 RepID=UPI00059524F9|nr:hypothetical protein [Nocardia takedensis]